MDSGGQYAVLGLVQLMLTLSASNWDMIPTTQCSIHHRMLCTFDLFIIFLHLYRYSSSSQPIWSTNMHSTSSDRCFGSRNSCPSSSVTSCTHYNDVSVVCSKYTYPSTWNFFWALFCTFMQKQPIFMNMNYNFDTTGMQYIDSLTHPPTVP